MVIIIPHYPIHFRLFIGATHVRPFRTGGPPAHLLSLRVMNSYPLLSTTGWCFEPTVPPEQILVKLDICPNFRGENNTL